MAKVPQWRRGKAIVAGQRLHPMPTVKIMWGREYWCYEPIENIGGLDVWADGEIICHLSWSDSTKAKVIAQADLISAAPDLREIVRRGVACGAFGRNLHKAAKAALAKANGEVQS